MASVASAASPAEVDSAPIDPRMLAGWIAMVVGMFLAILDIQIVASSLNEIQAGLAASPDEISWVQTSYLIAEVVMIPLSGYLARMWGSRRLFVVSAIGFTLTSLACAFAWSLPSLIVLRVLQGFIGGGMIPCVFSSVYLVFPRSRQPMANVAVGMIVTCAPAVGPTLGGFITEWLSWHWLFAVNVIPGLIVVMLVASMPDFDRGDSRLARGFDVQGLILMALFLGGLEFVLDEGPRDDWFDEPVITVWTGIAISAGVLFLWRCFSYRQPIVDLCIFRDRNFTLGCLLAAVLGFGLFGGVYVIPLLLARIHDFNALQIETVMSVTGIFMFLGAPVAGKLAERFGPRAVLTGGIVLAGAGFLGASGFNADSEFDALFWPQAIRGVGLVWMIISVNTIALGTLPPDKLSNASGLYNLARNMGGAVGLAAINTLLDSRFALHMARLSDWINPARPEYQAFAANVPATGAIADGLPALQLAQQIASREAIVMTFNDTHLLMGACFVGALALTPLLRRPRQQVAVGH